jgi:hypothetical protein
MAAAGFAGALVTFGRKIPGDTNFANFVTLESPPRRICSEGKLTKLTVRRVFEGDSGGAVEGDSEGNSPNSRPIGNGSGMARGGALLRLRLHLLA